MRAAGFSGAAAGKTGTTNDAADVWFVGYTPELVGGVWIGLDRRATIVRGASGGTLAAPVWGRVMRRVYADRPAPEEWPQPSGVSTALVVRGTGEVENPECPSGVGTYTEYFLYSPPAPRFCNTAPPAYTWYGDTLWGDEEWNTGAPLDSTFESDSSINWPELEELRRRLGEEGGAGADTLAGDTLTPLGGDTVPLGAGVGDPFDPEDDDLDEGEADAESEAGEGETDEEGEVQQEPPPVLGDPIQRGEENPPPPAATEP